MLTTIYIQHRQPRGSMTTTARLAARLRGATSEPSIFFFLFSLTLLIQKNILFYTQVTNYELHDRRWQVASEKEPKRRVCVVWALGEFFCWVFL